jgi:type III restriction enzyme
MDSQCESSTARVLQQRQCRYVPDFIVSGQHGNTLVLEIKGQKSPQNDAKHAALEEWVAAINADQRFGKWSWAVAYQPVEVHDIVAQL